MWGGQPPANLEVRRQALDTRRQEAIIQEPAVMGDDSVE